MSDDNTKTQSDTIADESKIALVTPSASNGDNQEESPTNITSLLEKMLPWIGAIAGIVTIASVITVVLEYRQRGHIEQAKSSIALIDVWEDKRYKEKYEILINHIEKRLDEVDNEQIAALGKLPVDTQLTAFGKLGKQAVMGSTRVEQTKKEIDELFYFFSRLTICIKTEVCSEDVSRAYFQDPVYAFWLYFNWFAKEKRERNYAGFGSEVEEFALQRQ